jgi:hypothetical protein
LATNLGASLFRRDLSIDTTFSKNHNAGLYLESFYSLNRSVVLLRLSVQIFLGHTGGDVLQGCLLMARDIVLARERFYLLLAPGKDEH